MATATLIVHHRVQDYAAWRNVYETVEPLRQSWAEATQKMGVDPKTAMAELEASLAKYQAGF